MKSINTEDLKVAKILFEIGSVLFRTRQPFKFASGIISPVYVDNRYLISYPKERKIVANLLASKAKNLGQFDVIAGTATAGIAHAAWVAQILDMPMVYVRSKPKDHGRSNQVEGKISRGQKVLIIEDTVSTAGSSIEAIKALRKVGATVTNELAIYTHGLKASEENFRKHKVKAHFLTNLKSVAQVAQKQGLLKPDQITIIEKWAEDPNNWGKKMGFVGEQLK